MCNVGGGVASARVDTSLWPVWTRSDLVLCDTRAGQCGQCPLVPTLPHLSQPLTHNQPVNTFSCLCSSSLSGPTSSNYGLDQTIFLGNCIFTGIRI